MCLCVSFSLAWDTPQLKSVDIPQASYQISSDQADSSRIHPSVCRSLSLSHSSIRIDLIMAVTYDVNCELQGHEGAVRVFSLSLLYVMSL